MILKMILVEKWEHDPSFVLGRFKLEITKGFTIGDFRVLEKVGGGEHIKIGIWNGSEEKSNIFIKKEVQQKLIALYHKMKEQE